MAYIFLKVFVSSLRSVPCPFNTIDFGYSTAGRFAISACTATAKDHPFAETPSSSIQHVKELSLLKFVLLLQDTPALSSIAARILLIYFGVHFGRLNATLDI